MKNELLFPFYGWSNGGRKQRKLKIYPMPHSLYIVEMPHQTLIKNPHSSLPWYAASSNNCQGVLKLIVFLKCLKNQLDMKCLIHIEIIVHMYNDNLYEYSHLHIVAHSPCIKSWVSNLCYFKTALKIIYPD